MKLHAKELVLLKMSSSVALISTWALQPDQIIIVSCIIWITGHCQMEFPPSSTVKLLWLEMGQESENITKIAAKVSAFFCMLLFLSRNMNVTLFISITNFLFVPIYGLKQLITGLVFTWMNYTFFYVFWQKLTKN